MCNPIFDALNEASKPFSTDGVREYRHPSLINRETVTFFHEAVEVEFTAEFLDDIGEYRDESICVKGENITELFTEEQRDEFYRMAMLKRR